MDYIYNKMINSRYGLYGADVLDNIYDIFDVSPRVEKQKDAIYAKGGKQTEYKPKQKKEI